MPSLFKSSPYLIQFAQVAAGIAIFVAPFRASAGLRGAMLVLAGVAILAAYQRAGRLRQVLPPYKFLAFAAGAWILSASLWSWLSPSLLESLSVMKRDVLTPILAALVFFALTKTRKDMMRWLSVLTAGLSVLTIMIIIEPFDPQVAMQESEYVSVGLITTWIVTLAPLLAVLLFPSAAWRSRANMLLALAIPCLLVSAWLSGNRTVWVCFAGMLLVAMIFATQGRVVTRTHWARIAGAIGLLAVLVALLVAAMQFRAQTQAPAGTGPLTFLLHDNRAPILRVAVEIISQHPWLGVGYANPDLEAAFAVRFEAPWLKNYVQHAHNVVLDHMLQMGVTGAIVIIVLFAALAWTFITQIPRGGLARLAGLCGVALVAGVFLRNMTDDFFSRHSVQFFGAAVGMLFGLATYRDRAPALAQLPAAFKPETSVGARVGS